MFFCDVSMAAQIERAEIRMLERAVANVARRAGGENAFVQPLASGLAGYAEPGSPLNKITGLGFDGPLDEHELARIEADYAARGCPVQAEVATLADPKVAALLTRRGYELVGFENVLGLELGKTRAKPEATSIDVSPSPLTELEDWLDVIAVGFATPDTQGAPSHETFEAEPLKRVLRDFCGSDGVVRYLARRGGERAGAGTVHIADEVAQLCGASTLPDHRRRGVQTALLAQRLADSAKAGCKLATMATQPGSTSQHNAERHGFRLLYSRAVLIRRM